MLHLLMCIHIYIYMCCIYVWIYVCIHVTMHGCAYVHTHTHIYIYICPVVYVVRLVLFSSIILLANRSSRNIFLLRSITSQRRQKNVPYFEKLQHLELFIQCCSSPVQPRQISLHNVLQGTSRHLWACRTGRQYFVCPICIHLKYVPT